MRWPESRDLNRRESPVRDPPHPDVPVAPRLGCQPLDCVVAVTGLVGGVFIQRNAVGPSRPAHIQAAQGIAVSREVSAALLIGVRTPIVLAIRDHLEDRRAASVLVCIGRHPEVRRQFDAVACPDPDVSSNADADRLRICPVLVGHGRSLRRGQPRWPRGRVQRVGLKSQDASTTC